MPRRKARSEIQRRRNRAPAAGKAAASVCEGEAGLDTIGYLIRYAHRALVRSLASGLKEHDISPAQWSALRELWKEDGYSQVELAQRIRVEKASLTSVLDSLESRGLIRRVRSGEDRRRSNVYLTEAGRASESLLIPSAIAANRQALAGIAEDKLAIFREVLVRLLRNLDPESLDKVESNRDFG